MVGVERKGVSVEKRNCLEPPMDIDSSEPPAFLSLRIRSSQALATDGMVRRPSRQRFFLRHKTFPSPPSLTMDPSNFR